MFVNIWGVHVQINSIILCWQIYPCIFTSDSYSLQYDSDKNDFETCTRRQGCITAQASRVQAQGPKGVGGPLAQAFVIASILSANQDVGYGSAWI